MYTRSNNIYGIIPYKSGLIKMKGGIHTLKVTGESIDK